MAIETAPKKSRQPRAKTPDGISLISVCGYKSISEERSVEIRPLTILAGANSSGKSSIMQPLLLMKQTLEANYDPGAILLDGGNIRFTSSDQILSRITKSQCKDSFSVGLEIGFNSIVKTCFVAKKNKTFEIEWMDFIKVGEKEQHYKIGMNHDEITDLIPKHMQEIHKMLSREGRKSKIFWKIVRNRCFLDIVLENSDGGQQFRIFPDIHPAETALMELKRIIHLPGLRGNPERNYPVSSFGNTFVGRFESYTASIISQWQDEDNEKLVQLSHYLEILGLTSKVKASPIKGNATTVEIKVGRVRSSKKVEDLVSIADVGFGVSQTLPVLVALLVAQPGQIVYLEQPEIHLHPRAQVAISSILADAATRGVRVVVETHSSLLLLGIQTLVAEEKLPSALVKLHWFTRRLEDGVTEVSSRDLDEAGSFGDWPEDFADVSLEAQANFLDANEIRRYKLKNGHEKP
jgi:ABC-type cobalamin/Fe3+-siderophores transport system ATPase subunit